MSVNQPNKSGTRLLVAPYVMCPNASFDGSLPLYQPSFCAVLHFSYDKLGVLIIYCIADCWIVPASLLYEVFSFNIIVTGENTFSCRGSNLSESDKMRKTRKRRVEGPKLP